MSKHSKEDGDSKTVFKIIGIIIAAILVIMLIGAAVWDYFGGTNINKKGSQSTSHIDPLDEALNIAYEEFEKLEEKNLNIDDFKVTDINNNGVQSYYITSENNSIEIRKDNFKIIRLNEERK